MPKKGARATKAQLAALARGRQKLARLKGAGKAKRGKNKKPTKRILMRKLREL